MRSRRNAVFVVSGIAIGSLVVGLAVGSRLTSPADAAARTAPPKASKITVPVEFRALESKVVGRADASYEGASKVSVPAGGAGIVTGKVPRAGSRLESGQVLLEIVGRPVIALEGVLPVYRSLRPGHRGPDVKQLEQELARLGLRPGDVDGVYSSDTADAVERLYDRSGYSAPKADKPLLEAVKAARKRVEAAEDALDRAQAGPSRTERTQAENEVRAAERELADASKAGDKAREAAARDRLRDAQARLSDLLDGRDTSAERKELAAARTALGKALAAAGTPLPSSEIVYVKTLPRRIDDVKVARGSKIKGPVVSVSGTALTVTMEVETRVKQLLKTGMRAVIDLGGGSRVQATIGSITREKDGDGWKVVLKPGKMSSQQFELMRDSNVRVTIPVGKTRGKVLVVPVAALSAGPGGETRVEVVRGKKRLLVEVEVGLSADGYAEIKPVGDRLEAGDRVVVGR